MGGTSLNGLLSSPLVPIAGVLAAVAVMLLLMKFRRRAGADSARRLLLPIVVVVLTGLAVVSILGRMAQDERGAERRALARRTGARPDGPPSPRHGDADFPAALAGLRRAIELDRFGIAAHVLAVRDGC